MKKILVVIVCLLTVCLSSPPVRAGIKKEVKKGNLLYNEGRFEEALKQYENAYQLSPDSDIVNFDLGSALYKMKDYEKTIGHFEKSLVSDDPSLEEKASYNIGNAKYKYGISQEETNLEGAINLLEQSLRHYERALEIEPDDEDAKYNYEFVKKELERLKKKLKQQQQQQQQKQAGSKQQQEQKKEEQKSSSPQKEEDKQKSEEEKKEEEKQQQQEQQQKPQEQEEKSGQKESEEEKQKAGEKEQPQPRGEGGESAQPQAEKMSEKEAQMLLDSYRQEEEPRELYKEKIPTRGLPEVLKDW